MVPNKSMNGNGQRIKFASFSKSKNGQYRLAVKVGTQEEAYKVSVSDRDGIFALDLPKKLALKLRDFPVSDSKSLMANVRKHHKLLGQTLVK